MEDFVEEVEKVRKRFGYGYDLVDYPMRLFVSNEVFRSVFERILSENEELSKAYKGIMRGFNGDKEKLKKRIIKGYGEDMVYEGMKEGEYPKEEL